MIFFRLCHGYLIQKMSISFEEKKKGWEKKIYRYHHHHHQPLLPARFAFWPVGLSLKQIKILFISYIFLLLFYSFIFLLCEGNKIYKCVFISFNERQQEERLNSVSVNKKKKRFFILLDNKELRKRISAA